MAIPAIGGALPALPTLPTTTVREAPGTAGAAGAGGFAGRVAQAMDDLQTTHTKADNLAVKAATGDLQDAHDFMIAATEASTATELTVAVRNRAVEAFNSIMSMQI